MIGSKEKKKINRPSAKNFRFKLKILFLDGKISVFGETKIKNKNKVWRLQKLEMGRGGVREGKGIRWGERKWVNSISETQVQGHEC